jgi:flagellar biosynthesis protein FlhB
MADQPERDGRTEAATPHRLQKAREEGTVSRSHGIAAAAVMATGAAVLSLGGATLADRFELALRLGLSADPAALQSPGQMLAACAPIIEVGLGSVAALLILLAAAAFVADIAIGGWVFSTTLLAPDLSRVDPAAGFRRLFSRTAAAEIIKSLLKFVTVGAVAVWLAWHWGETLLHLAAETWPRAVGHAALVWNAMFVTFVVCLAGLALLELPYDLWAFRDRLKMTRQEVRDELRELEGSPQTRRRIRGLRQRLARMRMMAQVEKADVVVVNPDHYAAALRYQSGEMRAPRVVAKGAGLVALRIRALAREHAVAIIEAPRLARAIYRHVDLDDEIPTWLYPPVAEILAYVFRLRTARAGGTPPPPRPPDSRFEPPPEFAA